MLSTLQLGPAAVDIFLRILKTIDQEVINREVQQSSKVHHNATAIMWTNYWISADKQATADSSFSQDDSIQFYNAFASSLDYDNF